MAMERIANAGSEAELLRGAGDRAGLGTLLILDRERLRRIVALRLDGRIAGRVDRGTHRRRERAPAVPAMCYAKQNEFEKAERLLAEDAQLVKLAAINLKGGPVHFQLDADLQCVARGSRGLDSNAIAVRRERRSRPVPLTPGRSPENSRLSWLTTRVSIFSKTSCEF